MLIAELLILMVGIETTGISIPWGQFKLIFNGALPDDVSDNSRFKFRIIPSSFS
jgi:hypothetical protein